MQTAPFSSYGPMSAAPFVAQFEGLELKAYRCPAGIWTIGYGHTGPDVHEGMVITKDEALALLGKDLASHVLQASGYIAVDVTQNQFIALTSFIYNIGVGAFRDSTLLKLLNRGDIQGAADQFLLWNKAGGKVLAGLTRRREAERALFLKD